MDEGRKRVLAIVNPSGASPEDYRWSVRLL